MASLAAKKVVGAPFSNSKEIVRVRYDFANDGGATGSYDVIEADGEILITDMWAVVKTTCTSGGSATLDAGITSDDDHLVAAAAVATLTAGAVLRPLQVFTASGTADTSRLPLRLTDGQVATMDIDAAAFTAGVIEFVYEVAKA